LFRTGDFFEDFAGGLGPDEGLGIGVVVLEVVHDGAFELADALEGAGSRRIHASIFTSRRPRLPDSIWLSAFFRGIPPLVLLYIIYFGLPTLAQDSNSTFLIAILAPLNSRLFAAPVAFDGRDHPLGDLVGATEPQMAALCHLLIRSPACSMRSW
jgi:hypothetical protein